MTVRHPGSVGVVGAGIIGLAVARQLSLTYPGIELVVFDKERQVASHQSSHNSGVVHAGVYYEPGSLKAQLCRRGAGLLREFCEQRQLPFRKLGKLIVATSDSQLAGLAAIERRAVANSIPDIRRLNPAEIGAIEPFATGLAALHSPHTACVDYRGVCDALANDLTDAGGQLRLGIEVTGLSDSGGNVELQAGGLSYRFDQVIVCAGLQSDQLARPTGSGSDLRIIPFRGEYYAIRAEAADRVRGMIYPVPDPRYPFLGVHLSRDVHDVVRVGPNAVLALALEGYGLSQIALRDLSHIIGWPGTWRLVRKHWRHGLDELAGSLSKRRYLSQVQAYVPTLQLDDLQPATSGVRAQAVRRNGDLVDDFVLQDAGRIFLVRNAPSPAATSSLAIAEHVVSRAAGTP
jgi:L-2-hydroxyglutarate oxidase